MRTVRLWTQSAGVIRPATLYHRDMSAKNTPGASAFRGWCYICNRPVQVVRKVHEGDATIASAWEGQCHRHGRRCDPHACELSEHRQVIELLRASNEMELFRIDEKSKALMYFASDAWNEAAKSHWTDGASG